MPDGRLDESLATGCRGLDREHHMQLDLLASFCKAVSEGRQPAEVDEILDRLIDYSKVHFSSEELLMRLYHYPDFSRHADDHGEAVEHLQDLRRNHLEGKDALALSSAAEMSEVLARHIGTADQALGSFLVRVGVGPG